jgi:hypothetical protein
MFFFAENLTSQSLSLCRPWEFKATEKITAQVRGSKEDRQAWYQNPKTKHCFYTGIEPINPQMRPGKENPPHKIHAFCADYDAKIPAERVAEVISAMRCKPAWVERSLGGNVRLVWTLTQPLLVDDYAFCAFILESAMEWLQLEMLPALDDGAFKAPSRLLCNGCDWSPTGHPAIPVPALQAFFVDCGRKFRFRPANETDIPLSVVEAQLRIQFPNLNWPGDFTVESQGPSFWIAESVSPLSAIIKPTGIFTFSAHATKPFYTWSDILGSDFVKQFTETSVNKATQDLWWDSKKFWRKISGHYTSSGEREMNNFLKVDCKLSSKPDKDGVSPVEVALSHIFNHNRIKAAVPFVFRASGPLEFLGERMLNTYIHKPIAPSPDAQTWGPQGNFPFLSLLFDSVFEPAFQLMHFLAWYQYYYLSSWNQTPMPGQNVFLMGGVGIGKTLINRQIVGVSVGGFVDASDYLVDGAVFNSHLMHTPHWCLDDDTPSNSSVANAKLHAMFKKTAANQQFLSNEKFQVSGMTEWMGRIGCTTNLDFISSRIVGPMDNSSLDKTCLFKCSPVSKFKFPARLEVIPIIQRELPSFLRWLIDWVAPDEIERDSRYGFASFQEETLLEQSHQSSPSAPFKELLIDAFATFFAGNPEISEWRGTVSQLIKMITADISNEFIMRSIRMDQVSRYLEQIAKEGVMKCSVETGPLETRIWKFCPSAPNPAALSVETMPEIVDKFSPV